MSTSERLNIYLEIEDNFVVPVVFSCVFDFILAATGLFSVTSRGLFAPDFLSEIAKYSLNKFVELSNLELCKIIYF